MLPLIFSPLELFRNSNVFLSNLFLGLNALITLSVEEERRKKREEEEKKREKRIDDNFSRADRPAGCLWAIEDQCNGFRSASQSQGD